MHIYSCFNLGREITVGGVTPHLIESFSQEFGADLVESGPEQTKQFIPQHLVGKK